MFVFSIPEKYIKKKTIYDHLGVPVTDGIQENGIRNPLQFLIFPYVVPNCIGSGTVANIEKKNSKITIKGIFLFLSF